MPGFPSIASSPGVLSELWQFTYNGLLFGANTDYELMTIEGLDPAEIRATISDRMQAHGGFTHAPFYGGRIITFRGSSVGDPVQPLMAAWSAAFRPQVSDQPLGLWLPGQPKERIYCKPYGKPTYLIDPQYSYGYAEWAVQLVAGNPRIFSDALNSLLIAPGSSGVAVNAGQFDAHPIFTLTGPIDTPSITLVGSGKFLKLNLMINAGQTVVIDEEARTIKLGASSLYSAFDDLAKWFPLAPGNNTIGLDGTSTTGATELTVEWRNARV